MFIDEATIEIRAGKGGDGAVSFRRERYVPRGGPDGGDGGRGGNVIVVGKHDLNTLNHFRAQKIFAAEDGHNGLHKKMHGKNGADCIVSVPLGTLITITRDEKEEKIDITGDNQSYVVAKGGNGGWGNSHFATSIKQAPAWSKQGLAGQHCLAHMELQLIADIGLVGLPNAGKSTLLSRLTNAHPKIADYPFTTLEPYLGVGHIYDKDVVIADIPGLIEGAAGGKGLGDTFLKHIRRTKILLYVVDATAMDPKKDLQILQKELEAFDASLLHKQFILAVNKIDLIQPLQTKHLQSLFPKATLISAASGEGLDQLKSSIHSMILE